MPLAKFRVRFWRPVSTVSRSRLLSVILGAPWLNASSVRMTSGRMADKLPQLSRVDLRCRASPKNLRPSFWPYMYNHICTRIVQMWDPAFQYSCIFVRSRRCDAGCWGPVVQHLIWSLKAARKCAAAHKLCCNAICKQWNLTGFEGNCSLEDDIKPVWTDLAGL